MSFFVDEAGNVWRGTRQHGFMMWRMEGLDPNGVPRYTAPRRFRLPEGFTDAKRIHYDAATDVLYLAGFSQAAPDGRDTWWAMGSTIAVCPNFMKNHASADDRPWKPGRLIYLPFCVEDGSGGDHTNAKAFTVAGDYIFVALAREGWITVYDRHNGRFVGRLQPGESVHGQSGWCDFNYAINAIRQADGNYLILHEERTPSARYCATDGSRENGRHVRFRHSVKTVPVRTATQTIASNAESLMPTVTISKSDNDSEPPVHTTHAAQFSANFL